MAAARGLQLFQGRFVALLGGHCRSTHGSLLALHLGCKRGDGCQQRVAAACCLLDLHLPDGPGLAAAQWMRRLMPPPLVLLCSTYAADELPRDVVASGLPYLDKAEVSEVTLSELLPPRAREQRTG